MQPIAVIIIKTPTNIATSSQLAIKSIPNSANTIILVPVLRFIIPELIQTFEIRDYILCPGITKYRSAEPRLPIVYFVIDFPGVHIFPYCLNSICYCGSNFKTNL